MTRETPRRRTKAATRRKKATALTSALKRRCLEMIEDGEFIIDVAARLNVARQSLYRARDQDDAFRKAWDEAAEIGLQIQADEAEKEMDFRGRIGWLEPKFYEGKVCGFVPRFSDALLLARLKALAPEKYAGKAKIDHNHTGHASGTIVVPGVMVPGDWEDVAKQMRDLGPPSMPELDEL